MKKISAVLFFALVFLPTAHACTGFIKKTTRGDVIYARTNEFADKLYAKILFIPRGMKFQGSLPNGSKKGMSFTTKHAIVGVGVFDLPNIFDGINEAGLGFGALFFPGYAEYSKFDPKNSKKDLASWEIGNWILGNFSSVDQVKKELSQIKIVNTPFADLGNIKFPLHYLVFDKTGKSIVIEPRGGKLKVYDNPVGAITNSPSFDWHLINLNNYVNLSPSNVSERKLPNIKLKQMSQGTGLLGLPGDFTSTSRFVRIVTLSQAAAPVKAAEEGVTLAWNIINNINIPKGTVRETEPNVKARIEYTQDVFVYDLANMKVYFRNYDNPAIRIVDANKFDPKGKNILVLPITQQPKYDDLTEQLKPM